MSDSPEKLQAPVEEKMQSESNEDKLKSKEEIIVKNPDVPKKTAESMQKNPIFREKAKTMLEKGVKNLIEKWEKLTNTPEGINKAKMLISYDRLSETNEQSDFGKKIDEKLKTENMQNIEALLNTVREVGTKEGYFPKKNDELINRASRILEEMVNVNNFDKKIWSKIIIKNCVEPSQIEQTLTYKTERTSGNAKLDQVIKSNPALKQSLDNRATSNNLWRLAQMTDTKDPNPNEQIHEEIKAKIENSWKDRSSSFDRDPQKQANEFLATLSQLSPEDLDSDGAYELKDMMVDLLNMSGDRTFTGRDLRKNNGIEHLENGQVSIKSPSVKTDNVQIISIWPEGIKMRNKITGQETILKKNTVQKVKERAEQRDADRKYSEEKRKEIAKRLGIEVPLPEDLTHEERHGVRMKVQKELIKEAFTKDQKLFDVMHRQTIWELHSRWNDESKGERIPEDFGQLLNEILASRGVKGQVDFSKGQNYLKAEVMNEQRVFVLTTPDYKIMIPFSGQLKLEKQPEMSYEEMNTPMQESEKSSAYRRAESTLEHPNSNKIQLVGLGLTSKEITSLLSQYSEKLEDISDLEINLGDNDITTFPTILLNMKTLKSVNLDNNRIKAFPKNNPSKKVEIKKEKCPNLQEISLDRNNLSTFTDEFLELDQIKHLSLNDNRFSELPSDISKLEHLKDLQIRENQLSKLPESITTLKELRSLQASRCGLTELPADFNKLKNLTVLWLSENRLKTLPDLSTLTDLWALYLNDNELTTLPSLGSLQKLEYLDIEDNKNLTTIPNDIKTLPNLKSEIKLSSNILSGEQMKDRFVDGDMSHQGYDFSDGANDFFKDKEQFKYTFAQGGSENEALGNAQKELKINETDQTFKMVKQLKNGQYSMVLFVQTHENEYFKK